MALKYGVVQGRLLPQVGDFIQNFPDDWREEFRIAKRVGASHIEWIDGAPNMISSNVIIQGADIDDLEVPISGICLDWLMLTRHVMNHKISENFMFKLMIKRAQEKGINRLVLPFLESSSLAVVRELDPKVFMSVIENFDVLLQEFPDVIFSIETDLDIDGMQEFICGLTDGKNFGVTFDIGNLTKLGYDLERHVGFYGDFIDSVHIKDCMVGGPSVPLGTGETPLNIMKRLIKLSSIEYFTFQTARDHRMSDEDTFKHNVNIIERVLDENR